MEDRKFMQVLLNYMNCLEKKEDALHEPFDYFRKDIRKFSFPDEPPKNVDNNARQFGSQPNWRQRKSIFENRSTSDEPKKRFPLWIEKNHTNPDELSNEERTRLMKEGRCFRCKKHGHRAHDCPQENEPMTEDGKLTPIQIRNEISRMDKKEKAKFFRQIGEEGLIVLKKTAAPEAAQTMTKKPTMKDLADEMKAMTKKEKAKIVELMEQEEELDSTEKETVPMQVSPSLDIYSVIANIDSQSMNIPMTISLDERGVTETDSLLDSGAGGVFIDQNYARKLHLDIKMLDIPMKARNVDGTENKRGTIKSYVDLRFRIGSKYFAERFFLTGLGKQTVILGFPWLKKHNPLVNWQTGHIDWRNDEKDTRAGPKTTEEDIQEEEEDIRIDPKPSIEDEEDQELWKNRTLNPMNEDEEEADDTLLISYLEEIKDDELWINAKMNIAVELAIKENEREGKKEISTEELVPEDLHDFLDVFNEEQADRFPESSPWDHKIEMKDGFEPKSFKVYNLTPTEQTELDKFLKKNLDKGYIRPSQSPMASPFFFVTKKDGRLRPCQDYRYLNDWTIKNAYPLPLISEIMDKLKGAKYFTKFD